jgi:hypothetical protein
MSHSITFDSDSITYPFDTESPIIKGRWFDFFQSIPPDSISIYNIEKDSLWNLNQATILAERLVRAKSKNQLDFDSCKFLKQLYLLHDYFSALTYIEHNKLYKIYRYDFMTMFEKKFKLTISWLLISKIKATRSSLITKGNFT